MLTRRKCTVLEHEVSRDGIQRTIYPYEGFVLCACPITIYDGRNKYTDTGFLVEAADTGLVEKVLYEYVQFTDNPLDLEINFSTQN